MRRLLLIIGLMLCASSARAQTVACIGMTQPLFPMAFEQITVSNTAVGFTAATIGTSSSFNQAIVAVITVETNAIRFRDDGPDPTSTVGMPAGVLSQTIICGRQALLNAKFIRATADALISVSYYRR